MKQHAYPVNSHDMSDAEVFIYYVDDLLSAIDLRRHAQENPGGKVSRWRIGGQTEYVQVLYYPLIGRAGVAWGGDATWTHCSDAADAVLRVCLTGEVVP